MGLVGRLLCRQLQHVSFWERCRILFDHCAPRPFRWLITFSIWGVANNVRGTSNKSRFPRSGPGDLILVRVLPPFREFPSPSVAVTTPYVLLGSPKADWLDYFERQQILAGAPGSEERLYRHMKWGKDDWYWSEFVFCGYVNHRSDAIFLAGLPDRPETQPHHKEFDEVKSRLRFAPG
jgi:hypothetical protein